MAGTAFEAFIYVKAFCAVGECAELFNQRKDPEAGDAYLVIAIKPKGRGHLRLRKMAWNEFSSQAMAVFMTCPLIQHKALLLRRPKFRSELTISTNYRGIPINTESRGCRADASIENCRRARLSDVFITSAGEVAQFIVVVNLKPRTALQRLVRSLTPVTSELRRRTYVTPMSQRSPIRMAS